MNLADWTKGSQLVSVLDLRSPDTLPRLQRDYGTRNPRVLRGVVAQALAAGAQAAVVEYRYIDADYRNEHSRFYSTTFRRYPSVTHRLHFFGRPPHDLLDDERAASFADRDYVGFSVMRPVAGGPVGRTLIRPAKDLAPHVSCAAEASAHLFGETLAVRASPFIAQEAQLGVCAHATLWVTAHYHHLRFGHPRYLPGDIADAVPAELGPGRPLPSKGLYVSQVVEASRRLGLPALLYPLQPPPSGETVFTLACRYLNSGIPVIVASPGHAFVLVGYRWAETVNGDSRIEFIRQDDETAPYQLVPNALLDTEYGPWQYLIVPLPARVYVSGEDAEVTGRAYLEGALARAGSARAKRLLAELRDGTTLTYRSTLLPSTELKSELGNRNVPERLRAIYSRLQLPRWVWVVEIVRWPLPGRRRVVAEAIIDATDHGRDMRVLAWRIPGELGVWWPDLDRADRIDLRAVPLLPSVSRVPG